MSKQLTPLEALETLSISIGIPKEYIGEFEIIQGALIEQIRDEKKLKALEILKDCCLVREGFGGYELGFAMKKNITKQEYDLLKEVLL